MDKIAKGILIISIISFSISFWKIWFEIGFISFVFGFYATMFVMRHYRMMKKSSGLKDDYGHDILIGDKVEFFNGMTAGQDVGHIGTVFCKDEKIIVKDEKGHIINYDLSYSKFKVIHMFWRHQNFNGNILSATPLPSILGWRKRAKRHFSDKCQICGTWDILENFKGQRLCVDCLKERKGD